MTTRAMPATIAGSPRALVIATVAGVALGVAYTLSPLSIWAALGLVLLGRTLVKDLDPTERRVILAIFLVAILLRALLLGGLFLSIDHTTTPFGSLFGDEEYLKRRSLWLRSMALGVNVSEADRAYALEEYSETSYLYVLAFLQMVVGDAPYGVHVVSMCAYLAAAVWLFRFSRRTFGPAPAALSFVGVLFLPTLFFWSVSALRESVHFLFTLAAIAGATDALTREGWRRRLAGAVVASLALYALKDLREGSMAIVLIAVVAGAAAARTFVGWRQLLIAGAALALLGGVALTRPVVQERVMATLRTTALRHQGHAFTAGIHYKLLEPRFYEARTLNIINDLRPAEAVRYVVRGLVAALVVPWPSQAETGMLKAYLPEHVVWLLMAVLFPVGIWAGAQRHATATFIMAAYVAVMFVAVALYSGNVGTLVRHRGLFLPFVICISAVAVCDALARVGAAGSVDQGAPHRWR